MRVTGKKGGESIREMPQLRWLLGEFCHENNIDKHELDSTLTYNENKELLEKKFGQLKTPSLYKNMAAKAARTRSDRGSGLLPKSKERKWPVAIYCTVEGRSEADVQERVWKFCHEIKANLGRDLVVESVEVNQ